MDIDSPIYWNGLKEALAGSRRPALHCVIFMRELQAYVAVVDLGKGRLHHINHGADAPSKK